MIMTHFGQLYHKLIYLKVPVWLDYDINARQTLNSNLSSVCFYLFHFLPTTPNPRVIWRLMIEL